MTQRQQDELAQLFASQLNVSQARPAYVEPVAPPPVRRSALPIDFASCHYTGTAHVRAETVSEPSSSPPPPYQEFYVPHETAYVLRQHSIDPASLSQNQIRLFQNADYEQKLRLLELWRISPPSYPQSPTTTTWRTHTSLEKEELEAKIRFEQSHATPRLVEIAGGHPSMHFSEAEPYIADGYETKQTYPLHLDPVYASNNGLWNGYNFSASQGQTYENQNMHDQIRNHADWERLNERIASERMMNMHRSGDEEMVL